MKKTLYITNLGLLDNLAHTQILPYLEGLSKKGAAITILSFEKKENLSDPVRLNNVEEKVKGLGMEWERLIYHNRWGNVYDVFAGMARALKMIRSGQIKVLHARASIPVIIAWPIAKIKRLKLIYDRRGTMAGDFVDDVNVKNIFSMGFLSRMLDAFDRFLIRHSDATIVLSDRSREMLMSDPRIISRGSIIEAIPCCTDVERFEKAYKKGLKTVVPEDKFVMCYLGSLGTCYLLKEMIGFFKELKAKKDNAFFIIISHTDRGFIEAALRKESLESGKDYVIINLLPEDVPFYLDKCDCSIMFIKPVECKIGSSPTKFGESLAAGVPVIVNSGIGDTEKIINDKGVGIVVKGLDHVSYEDALSRLFLLLRDRDGLKKRCRETAKTFFAIELGVKRYSAIYERLSVS